MFDLSIVNKRYFEIKISVEDDEGKEYSADLEVEPPKLKALKKITALSKSKEDEAIDDLQDAMRLLLNKNKAKYKVPNELIENLDLDQMNEILTAYFEWLAKSKNSPN